MTRNLKMLAVSLACLLPGCGASPALCQECPDFGGTYHLTWGTPTRECAGLMSPATPELELSQNGPALRGRLADTPVVGSIFEDFSFALSVDGSDKTTLIGAPSAPLDGVKVSALEGSFVSNPEGERCTFRVGFAAGRL